MSSKTGRPRGTITRRFTIAGFEVTIRRLVVKRARKEKRADVTMAELVAAAKVGGAEAPELPPAAVHNELCDCVLCYQRKLGTSTISASDIGVTTVRYGGPGGAPEVPGE